MDDLIAFLRARLDDTNTDLHTVECGWHQREFGHEGIDCTCGAPERLLAEVDAKRKIVSAHESAAREALDDPHNDEVVFYAKGLERAVRVLALPHAGHPDYRAEWRT